MQIRILISFLHIEFKGYQYRDMFILLMKNHYLTLYTLGIF